jgi:hypothetical protein
MGLRQAIVPVGECLLGVSLDMNLEMHSSPRNPVVISFTRDHSSRCKILYLLRP